MEQSRWATFKQWFSWEQPDGYYIRDRAGRYLTYDGKFVHDQSRGRIVKGLDAAWDVIDDIEEESDDYYPVKIKIVV